MINGRCGYNDDDGGMTDLTGNHSTNLVPAVPQANSGIWALFSEAILQKIPKP